jgi:hypothetical protein
MYLIKQSEIRNSCFCNANILQPFTRLRQTLFISCMSTDNSAQYSAIESEEDANALSTIDETSPFAQLNLRVTLLDKSRTWQNQIGIHVLAPHKMKCDTEQLPKDYRGLIDVGGRVAVAKSVGKMLEGMSGSRISTLENEGRS